VCVCADISEEPAAFFGNVSTYVRRHSDLYMPGSELPPFRRTDLRGGLIDSSARVCEYSGWRAAVIT